MGDFSKKISAGLSTEGVTKKDGKHVKTEKHEDGITLNTFHQKIIEARIKQSNRKWLVKEIILGLVGAFIVYVLITAK